MLVAAKVRDAGAAVDRIDRKIAAPGIDDAIHVGAVGIKVDRSRKIRLHVSARPTQGSYQRLSKA